MIGKRLWEGAEIKAWGLIAFDNCIRDGDATHFENELIQMA